MRMLDNFDKLRLAAYEAAVSAYQAALAAHFASFDDAFETAFVAAQAAKTSSQMAHALAHEAAEVRDDALTAYNAAQAIEINPNGTTYIFVWDQF